MQVCIPVVFRFGIVPVVFWPRILYECAYVVLVVSQSNKPWVRTVTVLAVSCSLALAVKPLKKSLMYDIAEEDPSVYSDEEDYDVGFVLRREWKEVLLPSKPKEEDETLKYLAEAQ